MKKISEQEIRQLMNDLQWGTLIAVDEGQPYAVETSFAADETHLYTGTKNGGRMNRCIEKNPVASFKLCDGDMRGKNFRAAIVETRAEILRERDEILYCLKIIYKKLGLDEKTIEERADKIATGTGSLSLYRLPLHKLGGIASGS